MKLNWWVVVDNVGYCRRRGCNLQLMGSKQRAEGYRDRYFKKAKVKPLRLSEELNDKTLS